MEFIESQTGKKKAVYENFIFLKDEVTEDTIYWKCDCWHCHLCH